MDWDELEEEKMAADEEASDSDLWKKRKKGKLIDQPRGASQFQSRHTS